LHGFHSQFDTAPGCHHDHKRSGFDLSQLVEQVQTFLDELKGDGMPCITTIGVQALYSPDILVEIEMVVRVP
jgi:enamine deaminase RidA (YjgF/YER057c/UK114 family)